MTERQPMVAGWYPDPERDGFQRRWNGDEWVGPSVPLGRPKRWWIIPAGACLLLAVVVLVVGALAPEDDEEVRADATSTTERATTTEATTTTDRVTTEQPSTSQSTTTTTAATTTAAAPTTAASTTTAPARPEGCVEVAQVVRDNTGIDWRGATEAPPGIRGESRWYYSSPTGGTWVSGLDPATGDANGLTVPINDQARSEDSIGTEAQPGAPVYAGASDDDQAALSRECAATS